MPASKWPVERIQRENTNVPFYETVLIARQDITAAQADGLVETFEKVISDQGGTVPKKESWGLRSMAYKIKKNRKGHYALMNIDAPAAAIQEMERQMHLNEDVLRHLVTRVDELEEGPSAVLRAKDRGDARARRNDGDRGYSKPADNPADKPAAAAKEDKPEKAAAADDTDAKAKAADAPVEDKDAGDAT